MAVSDVSPTDKNAIDPFLKRL